MLRTVVVASIAKLKYAGGGEEIYFHYNTTEFVLSVGPTMMECSCKKCNKKKRKKNNMIQ